MYFLSFSEVDIFSFVEVDEIRGLGANEDFIIIFFVYKGPNRHRRQENGQEEEEEEEEDARKAETR